EELPAIAANRGLEPKQLRGLVRGELDWIVMKCLEKDRNRRYETADGLAADIERYLNDEPVPACPPSAGDRFGKFARRHRRGGGGVSLRQVRPAAQAGAGDGGAAGRDAPDRRCGPGGQQRVGQSGARGG